MQILGWIKVSLQLGSQVFDIQLHVAKMLGQSFLLGRDLVKCSPELNSAVQRLWHSFLGEQLENSLIDLST